MAVVATLRIRRVQLPEAAVHQEEVLVAPRAQGKALFRTLLRRQTVPVKPGKNRSHHPLRALVSIPVVLVGAASLLGWPVLGGWWCPAILISSSLCLIVLQAPFWIFLRDQKVVRTSQLPLVALLGGADFLVLGIGAITGGVAFLAGRRY